MHLPDTLYRALRGLKLNLSQSSWSLLCTDDATSLTIVWDNTPKHAEKHSPVSDHGEMGVSHPSAELSSQNLVSNASAEIPSQKPDSSAASPKPMHVTQQSSAAAAENLSQQSTSKRRKKSPSTLRREHERRSDFLRGHGASNLVSVSPASVDVAPINHSDESLMNSDDDTSSVDAVLDCVVTDSDSPLREDVTELNEAVSHSVSGPADHSKELSDSHSTDCECLACVSPAERRKLFESHGVECDCSICDLPAVRRTVTTANPFHLLSKDELLRGELGRTPRAASPIDQDNLRSVTSQVSGSEDHRASSCGFDFY